MRILFTTVAVAASLMMATAAAAASTLPTVVLVHGAFADSSSWNGVVAKLLSDGYKTVAVANPLRSVTNDAREVSELLNSIKGPVVLVGHSYGGQVITNAARGHGNVKAMVFVAAFAPDLGEAAADLAGKFPGGTLGQALVPVAKANDGEVDLYIDQMKFREQFAADVPADAAALMAVSQRPITEKALTEKSGEPAWKTVPSYFVYGSEDKNIPAKALQFMAERAGSKRTVVVEGGSHVVMVSRPQAVVDLIEQAAR